MQWWADRVVSWTLVTVTLSSIVSFMLNSLITLDYTRVRGIARQILSRYTSDYIVSVSV